MWLKNFTFIITNENWTSEFKITILVFFGKYNFYVNFILKIRMFFYSFFFIIILFLFIWTIFLFQRQNKTVNIFFLGMLILCWKRRQREFSDWFFSRKKIFFRYNFVIESLHHILQKKKKKLYRPFFFFDLFQSFLSCPECIFCFYITTKNIDNFIRREKIAKDRWNHIWIKKQKKKYIKKLLSPPISFLFYSKLYKNFLLIHNY